MTQTLTKTKIPGFRPLLYTRLWLKAFMEVARWRATMMWMFYSTSMKPKQFLK